MVRSKLQGSAREIAVHLGSSRVAAMRLGRNVVVQPQFDTGKLVSFVDDNENFAWDDDEKVLSTLPLPGSGGNRGVYMMGPDGVVGTQADPGQALEGLTLVDGEDEDDPRPWPSSSPTARSAIPAASGSRTASPRPTCSRCASTRPPLPGWRC